MATHHARAVEDGGVVERRSFPLLHRVEAPADVRQLPNEELVDFEPVGGVGVGKEVVDHVVDAEVREPQRRVVVVELERADARRVGHEGQHEDVAHQPHVIGNVLGHAVGRPRHVGPGQHRLPALELAALPRRLDPPLDVADALQVFIELPLVAAANGAAEVLGILPDRIENTHILARRFVLEEPVEGEGGIDLQRRR